MRRATTARAPRGADSAPVAVRAARYAALASIGAAASSAGSDSRDAAGGSAAAAGGGGHLSPPPLRPPSTDAAPTVLALAARFLTPHEVARLRGVCAALATTAGREVEALELRGFPAKVREG